MVSSHDILSLEIIFLCGPLSRIRASPYLPRRPASFHVVVSNDWNRQSCSRVGPSRRWAPTTANNVHSLGTKAMLVVFWSTYMHCLQARTGFDSSPVHGVFLKLVFHALLWFRGLVL
jgi:hypothetical protein